MYRTRWDPVFRTWSEALQVPYELLRAIAAVESSYNPAAIRPEPGIGDASRGLMQILLRTARNIGYTGTVEGLHDPNVNVALGARILRDLYAALGSWDDAISGYNGNAYNRPGEVVDPARLELGLGRKVRRTGIRCMGRVVPLGEYCNQSYVDKVRRAWEKLNLGKAPWRRRGRA